MMLESGGSGERAAEVVSFVLPVSVGRTGRDRDDTDRLRLLLASFRQMFDLSTLADFWIFCPPEELDEIASVVRQHAGEASVHVVSELACCPELAADPETRDDWPRPNRGWYRQQLIKLAAFEHVRSNHYVTLDSDVLFARPFGAADLFVSGRACGGVERRDDYLRLYTDTFADWEVRVKEERVAHAARVLGAPRPEGRGDTYYSETPVVYAVAAARALAERLERRAGRPWREALLAELPWTEQALYFHALELDGAVERHYALGGANSVLRIDHCLWQHPDAYRTPRTIESWDVEAAFSPTDPGFFVVVQSYLGIPVASVARRVGGKIEL